MNQAIGLSGYVTNGATAPIGSGTITQAMGVMVQNTQLGTGEITNCYGFYAARANITPPTGTIVNNYGLLIENQADVGTSLNYNIFSGGAGINHLEGPIETAAVFTLTMPTLGVASTDGICLTNSTDAADGAQQWSPRLRFSGQGWKTDSTAESPTLNWLVENQTVQGAANPTSNLVFSSQVNGGGYTSALTLGSNQHAAVGPGAVPDTSVMWGLYGPNVSTVTVQETTTLANSFNGGSFSGYIQAVQIDLEVNPAGTADGQNYNGINVSLETVAGNANNISNLQGNFITVQHNGSGLVTQATEDYVYVLNPGAGTIATAVGMAVQMGAPGTTDSYAFIAYSPQVDAGAVVNNYGLYIQNQAGYGSTLNYNIFSAGVGINYFEGNFGIGTSATSPAGILELASTTQGFLPPRMSTTQKDAISGPGEGLVVYDTDLHSICVYNGSMWKTATLT